MKKVLFTATVDSHILQFHLPYLKMFKENGYEVHVATNGKEEIPYCDKKHIVSFERSPFKMSNLKAIKQLKKICDDEKYDIIHCHTPMGSVVTRLAAKQSRKNGTRVIYTAHGFHFYKGAPLINWILFYPVEKYLSKYTDTLITINNEDYELAKKKFTKCKNIEYVPGVGIDTNKFDFEMSDIEKKELRESLGLKQNDFVMIYPAELNKNKNQKLLIQVMRKLVNEYKNIHLLLPGIDSYNGKYQKLVKKYKLENNIHFLGYRKDIPKLLRISNLAVSTSNREGLPINIIEAMYVGLPIIATNCRGNRDLVVDGKNGYIVDKNNKKEFVNAIINIYGLKDLFKKIIENNREDVKKYLIDEIIIIMNEIYNRKKKIIHLLASNKFSGAENVACTIIENLSDKYDMIYCSPNGDIVNSLNERNIKYYPLKKLSFLEVKKAINVFKPDIIHAHDYRASVICSIIKDRNIYLIEHLHSNSPWLSKICINSVLYLFAAMRACTILTVSKSIETEFIFSRLISRKINCTSNPTNRQAILKKICEHDYEKKYDICCVGRITEAKNPNKFIEIINMLKEFTPNIKAVWIGDGELKDDMLKKIQRLNLENNIEFVGFKTNPYKYMANSKLFLLTSDWEGYGLVAFEALTLGLPCIVSNVGGLVDIIDSNCGKLCNNTEEYVQEIMKLMNNDEYYENKKQQAIQKSIDIDNFEKYFDCLDKIYRMEMK